MSANETKRLPKDHLYDLLEELAEQYAEALHEGYRNRAKRIAREAKRVESELSRRTN